MKWFRLTIVRLPVVAPERVVTDYSPEEAAALRERFGPLVERYRRRSRMTGLGVAAGFVGMALGLALLPNYGVYFLFGGISAVLLIILAEPVTPDCPACRSKLDSRFGVFCPECGSESLRPGGWFSFPKCDSCGKTMYCGKGRRYKIRACSFCGLMLDQKGF